MRRLRFWKFSPPLDRNLPEFVTLALMTERPFVPVDFVVPLELVGPGFRLVPLGPEHNAADHAAWSGAWNTSGPPRASGDGPGRT